MHPLVPPVAIMAGLAFLGQLASRLQRRTRVRLYAPVAEELGLRLKVSGFLSSQTVMEGNIRGYTVAVQLLQGQQTERLRVTVDTAAREGGGIPAVLELERQRSALAIFGGEDVLTGDLAFDREVRVGGGVDAALSVLGPEARAAFLGLLERRPSLRVINGEVSVESDDSDTKALVRLVRAAVDLAARLAAPPDGTFERLARRAVEDPLPGVRLQAFAAASSADWGSGLAASTARRLLRDPHPELRLRAAIALGDAGFEELELIVRAPAPPEKPGDGGRLWWEMPLPGDEHPEEALLEDAASHERRRARALEHLAARSPRERVLPLVREALRWRGPVLVAALEAAAAVGDASLEAAAVDALRSSVPEVLRAAVHALGAVGSATAVARLRELRESDSPDRQLRREIDVAIAGIQSRMPGAAAGQVALAGEGEASGRVSLAAGSRSGSVSLASDPPGPR